MEVVALFVALIALVVAVAAVVWSRAGDKKAAAARREAAQAFERSGAAGLDAAGALEGSRTARADAAQALDRATRAQEEAAGAARRAEAAAHRLEEAAAPDRAAGSAPAPAAAPSPDRADEEGGVRWAIEHVKGALWVMRNTGTGVAHAALLTEATQPPRYIRPAEVIPRDVPPGDHLQFRLSFAKDAPPPRVRVVWRGEGERDARTQEATLVQE